MLVEGVAAVASVGAGVVGFGRVGDVVAPRHAGRRDGGAAGAVALHRLLLAMPALGDPGGLVGSLGQLDVGGRPALLELHARVAVAIRLVGGALPTPAGADGAALPPGFGQRVV